MRIARMFRHERGTAIIEFGLTAPLYLLMLFFLLFAGYLAWFQVGLQRGAEMGARCAAVNKIVCGSPASIQSYAAQHALGLPVSPSVFTFSSGGCGYEVAANYAFSFLTSYLGMPTLNLNARSCYPD
jgi:hypothetical protein